MKIITPKLIVDKERCIANIHKMASKAKTNQMLLRPHFKTHQSIEIGRWFKMFGINAITVSSVKMAAYFANDGWNDITIAFPFNTLEINELNKLPENIKINIIADNATTIQKVIDDITREVGVYIEISTGYKRSGISYDEIDTIKCIVKKINESPKLELKGFLTHAGNTYQAKSTAEIIKIHRHSVNKMNELFDLFAEEYPTISISIGDTPGCSCSDYYKNIAEIRPGNFIFYDVMQYYLGACNLNEIAIKVACPIVSKQASRNELVIYGGAIHFSKDYINIKNGDQLFGLSIPKEGGHNIENYGKLCRLSQEHGVLKVSTEEFNSYNIGDIIYVLPIHSCLTINAMREIITTQNDRITTMK